jgi:AcrR family transcriptional regulator
MMSGSFLIGGGNLNDVALTEQLSPYSKAKRSQIINGALETFLEFGYEGTSMNRVAEKAGVIKQTIYSHFTDKEGLFMAIIESLTLEHFRKAFGGEIITADQAPEVVLRKIAEILTQRQKDKSYVALMRTVIGESSRFPELARLYVRSVIKPAMKSLCDYFEANSELHLDDPEAIARIYCGALVNYVIMQEILLGKEEIPFEMDRLVNMLVKVVLDQSNGSKTSPSKS